MSFFTLPSLSTFDVAWTQVAKEAPEVAPSLARALIRLAPLIISSASLISCWDQRNAMRPFLHPGPQKAPSSRSNGLRTQIQATTPIWFAAFATPTLPFILLAYPLAGATGLINALRSLDGVPDLDPFARALFGGGAVFSLLHFAFAPPDVKLMGKIMAPDHDDDKRASVPTSGLKRENALASLLRLHRWRTLLVDFPAWLLYLAATLWMVKDGSN